MQDRAGAPTPGEWRRHWPVVFASLMGIGLTSTHVYAIGPFIGPLEAEFGWPRAQISLGVALVTLLGAIFSPFMGIAIDKLGPRRIALPGALLFCAGTALIAFTTNSLWVWLSLWLVVGIGALMIKPTVWTFAVASLFDKGRGLALAITLCGTGIASTVMPIVATGLIDSYGWRSAYLLMALLLVVVTFPIFYFCFDSAIDGKRRKPEGAGGPVFAVVGATVREALLSLRFLKLGLAAFVFTLAAIGITSNMVPILTSMQLSRAEAAGIASLAGVTSVLGRLATGFLIDRYNGNIVGGTVVLFPMITCILLLAAPGSVPLTILAVVILGLSLGAELDVIAYLTARHFGTARYGTIFGTISAVWSAAVTIGPTLANRIYDRTGNYELAIWGFLPLFALASLCLMTMGAFPDYSRRAPAE